VKVFYDWSGGMESSSMLVVERDRIRETGACVRWADTGKHFPEMYESKRQIESLLGLEIVTVPRRIDFDTYLFDRGGMLRKGANDCSRKMKRSNLMRHAKTFAPPYEINLGFNSAETERMDDFVARNERDWCHWRFPLIEHDISRADTVTICKQAGFTILVGMYEKMGRFDCFMCPNQTPLQARRVINHYPELADEWLAMEKRKGHHFMPIPLKLLMDRERNNLFSEIESKGTGCSCFGGADEVWEDDNEPACS
jgi:hypothetical protein